MDSVKWNKKLREISIRREVNIHLVEQIEEIKEMLYDIARYDVTFTVFLSKKVNEIAWEIRNKREIGSEQVKSIYKIYEKPERIEDLQEMHNKILNDCEHEYGEVISGLLNVIEKYKKTEI